MKEALYGLAEAAAGVSPETRWSLDAELIRREADYTFKRLSEGKLPVEAALNIITAQFNIKITHNLKIFREKLDLVLVLVTPEERASLPAVARMESLFSGNGNQDWVWDATRIRETIEPYFRMCALGQLSHKEALDAVIDDVVYRRELFLEDFTVRVHRLTEQVVQTGTLNAVLERESNPA